jgi:glycosyltransferase involved in cell wall biosynthesis
MNNKKLKVFHGLKNFGTQAGLFVKELRKQDIEAISVVHQDKFDRDVDVQIPYGGKNKIQRLFNLLRSIVRRFYWFCKYNTFHFYWGTTLLPRQWDLPFYKLFGKKVIMEYLGHDIRHYQTLVERYDLPESHVYYINMDEHDNKTRRRINNEKQHIDYIVSCLPTHVDFAKSYDMEVNEVLPLAINVEQIPYIPLESRSKDEPIIILHAPTNRIFKGTDYIVKAIESLKNEGYNIDFRLVEDVSHQQLFKEYERCDIFVDQISVGWYGTAALEAMCVGRPVCAFIDERYFQYIDYADEIPAINVTKENISNQLRKVLNKREWLSEMGKRSRAFVEKYHDIENVTKNLINIYKEKVWEGKI